MFIIRGATNTDAILESCCAQDRREDSWSCAEVRRPRKMRKTGLVCVLVCVCSFAESQVIIVAPPKLLW